MTNQREAFEKWWGGKPQEYHLDMTTQEKLDMWVWGAWQAAQADLAEYIALIELNNQFKDDNNAQLQLDNDTLRETLLQASRQLDLHEPCSTMCRIVSEVLFTTQPESQPTIRNNRTAQEPLSGMKILELANEYRMDVVMSDAINFARAIEKRIRTGE